MKKRVLTLALLLAIPLSAGPLLVSSAALAQQHNHGTKGPAGGKMQDVAGIHAELVVSGTTLTINAYNEDNKPISTQGYTGSLLVVAGSSRETLQLAPAGDSALKAEAKAPVPANASITLVIKTAAGKSGQVKF